MKFLALLLVAVLAATVSSKAIQKTQNEIDPRILSFLTDFYNQIIVEPINTLASALASMTVHLFAGIATEGLSGLGKRDLKGLGDLWDSLTTTVVDGASTLVSGLAAQLTQWLVNFALSGNNGRGFWGDLGTSITGSLSDLGNTLTQQAGLILTQILLSIGNNNARGLGDLWDSLTTTVVDGASTLVSGLAAQLTQWLVNFALSGNNGRGLTDFFSNLTSNLDSAVQAAALQVAIWLLNVTENGLLPTIGKRSLTN